MKVRFSHLILLLILPALLGAGAPTADSSTIKTIKTQPTKVNPKYSAQMSLSNTPSPGYIMLDSNGIPYPPCPGDPSNPNWPTKVPLCPDINGKRNPAVPEFVSNSTSTYLAAKNMNPHAYSAQEVYCPDICITTRRATPAPPTSEINAPVPVQSFEDATCPAGYAEVGDFNVQPGIAYIPIEQKVYGPFTSMSDFNAYNNNSAFECSIKVDTLTNDIPIEPVMYAPDANGSYNFATARATDYANGKSKYCSGTAGAYEAGSDNPPTYGTNGLIVDTNHPKNYVGQWVKAWTWSWFFDNPTYNTGITYVFDWRPKSFGGGDEACWGSGNYTPNYLSNVVLHRDIYWHYYRWQRCRPKQPEGWFYVNSFVPVSHVCARVKPTWQDSNP